MTTRKTQFIEVSDFSLIGSKYCHFLIRHLEQNNYPMWLTCERQFRVSKDRNNGSHGVRNKNMTLRVHIVSWSSVYLTLWMKPKLRTEVNFAQSRYSTQSHGAFAYFEMKSFKCTALFNVAKLQLILPYIFTTSLKNIPKGKTFVNTKLSARLFKVFQRHSSFNNSFNKSGKLWEPSFRDKFRLWTIIGHNSPQFVPNNFD